MEKQMKKRGILLVIFALLFGLVSYSVQLGNMSNNIVFAGPMDAASFVEVTVTLDYSQFDETTAGCTFEQYLQNTFQEEKEGNWEAKSGFTISNTSVALKIHLSATTDTYQDALSSLTGYIPMGHALEIAISDTIVSDTNNSINVVVKKADRMTLKETKKQNWWRIIQVLLDGFDAIFGPVLIIIATAGMFYAIYLGVSLAKAESEDKRAEAKKRMLWFILAFVITILLLIVIKLFINNIETIEDVIFKQK